MTASVGHVTARDAETRAPASCRLGLLDLVSGAAQSLTGTDDGVTVRFAFGAVDQ